MNDPLIVAIDQGTSSCRAFAVDRSGNVRAQKSKIFSPLRPRKEISFYQAEELLETQLEVLHALLEEVHPDKVAALAVCSQRSTIVLWDKDTGRALAPVLTWEDGRSLAQSDRADVSQAEVHAQTGLFKTPYFSAPKITWCLENYPSAKQAALTGTLLAAPVASYLIWHLTKGRVFATDPTLAQRTLLWNIQTGQWSENLCKAFGVTLACLPELRPTVADYGNYLYKGISIPICVCVADQQAAAADHALAAGQTLVNYGTGAFVLHHTGPQLVVLPGMLSSVSASLSVTDRQFLLEGPIFSAGSLFEWLKTKEIFVNYEQLDTQALAAKSPVLLLPALGGLGSPYWDYRVRVAAENITPATQPADWIAGILQAIAARVADIVYYLRADGYTVQSVLTSGGLSRSVYLLQTQADILGVPVYRQPETESTVLGTARLAADYLAWDTSHWTETPSKTFSPSTSVQESQIMYQSWQQFVQIQRSV